MRLLHLIQDLGIGGTERLLEDLLPLLMDSGHEVGCCCISNEGPIAKSLRGKGVEVSTLGLHSYWNPIQVASMFRFIRRIQPDLVHSHGSFANVFSGLAAILPFFPPLILHNHTLWTPDHPRRQLILERWVAARSDRVLCVSKATAQSFIEAGIATAGKVEVVYNGIDLQRFPFNGKQGGNRIISVGSLAPHKGHDVLVRAMQEIRRDIPDATLTLVGDGTERTKLECLVDELGIREATQFVGEVNHVQKYLQDSSLFVLPSIKREGLGIALLEAMATGLAAVATDCGGIGEVVEHGVSGLLVSPGDPIELSEAVVRLLTEVELAYRMAVNGRKKVEEQFSLEKTCQSLLNIYEEVVGA